MEQIKRVAGLVRAVTEPDIIRARFKLEFRILRLFKAVEFMRGIDTTMKPAKVSQKRRELPEYINSKRDINAEFESFFSRKT